MRNPKQSFIAAAVLFTLSAVIALLMSPSTRAQIAERVKYAVASVFVANTPLEPVPLMETTNSSLNAFHFLEPLAPKSGDPKKFDASLLNYLLVQVCEVSGDTCAVVKAFSAQGGSSAQLRIETNGRDGSYYVVNWDTQKFNFNRKTYRVRVILGGLQLGAIDLTPDVYTKFGRTWPIKFLIEADLVIRVRLLHFLGKSASQVASVLHNEFNLSAEETALLLANDLVPYSAAEIDLAIKGVYQLAIIPDTTKVSDEVTANALSAFEPGTGRMRFLATTPLLDRLNPGDVLVGEPSAAAPYGYLRKVTAIRKEKGGLVLETTQASLNNRRWLVQL